MRHRSHPLAFHVASMAAAASLLLGCPEQTRNHAPPAASAPCREIGQRCEFSPGKLGSCVMVDGCRSGNCFVCQSQH
jgi:hypothetical protein